jgi:hypothetical protein
MSVMPDVGIAQKATRVGSEARGQSGEFVGRFRLARTAW